MSSNNQKCKSCQNYPVYEFILGSHTVLCKHNLCKSFVSASGQTEEEAWKNWNRLNDHDHDFVPLAENPSWLACSICQTKIINADQTIVDVKDEKPRDFTNLIVVLLMLLLGVFWIIFGIYNIPLPASFIYIAGTVIGFVIGFLVRGQKHG